MNLIEQIQHANAAKLRALSGLHRELGYGSPQALADAILRSVAAPSSKPATTGLAKVVLGPKPGNARKGHRVPDETRKAIAAALKAGEVGSGLAAKFGVSYNIVHAIKGELGMVQPHKRSR